MTYLKNVFEPFWELVKSVCVVGWILLMVYLAVYIPCWTWEHLPNIATAWEFVGNPWIRLFDPNPKGASAIFHFIGMFVLCISVLVAYVAIYIVEWVAMFFSIVGVIYVLKPDDDSEEKPNKKSKSTYSKKSTYDPNFAKENPDLVPYGTSGSGKREYIKNKSLSADEKVNARISRKMNERKHKIPKQEVVIPEPVYVPPVPCAYTPEQETKIQEELYRDEINERLYYMERQNAELLEALNEMRRSMNMQEAEINRRSNESYLDKFSKLSFTEQAALMVVGKKVWDSLGNK